MHIFVMITIGLLLRTTNGQGPTDAMHLPPPTTEISPTDFFELSNTNTSCYVCGISNPGFGSKKCSVTYGGDLMETKHLIEASNKILKTDNTFNGCLTIYTNGVIIKKPSVMYGKEGCRKNYKECHPCLKTCSVVEKLCYCKEPGCNSDSRQWGPDWQTEPLSDPFIGADCSYFDMLISKHASQSHSSKRIHDDF